MTFLTDAFLAGTREYGERLYLDCYSKDFGRKLINTNFTVAGLKRFSLLRLAIYSNERGEYFLSSYETIIDSSGFSSEVLKRLEIASETILAILGKEGGGSGYKLIARCVDSVIDGKTDFRYTLIRAAYFAFKLIEKDIDLTGCKRCAVEDYKLFDFYFSVAKLELCCGEHVDADSFRIYPHTLEIFRRIVFSLEEDLAGCNFLSDSVSYIIYLMFESVAYRYGIYNILNFERFVSENCLKENS